MRVTAAVEEAKDARSLLDDLEGDWLDELKSVVALLNRIHGHDSDRVLTQAINDDIVKRLERIASSGNQRIDGLSTIHDSHPPLSTGFVSLSSASRDLLKSANNLQENIRNQLRATTLDGVSGVMESMQRFDVAKAEADACVRSWLAFDGDGDDSIHQLTLSIIGQESLAISTVVASLELLDIWFVVAAAGSGDGDLVDKITIERIESGSVVAWFKNVPPEVWDKVVELWSRVTNPELTQIGNVVAATNMLKIVAETTAQINRMKKSADLTPEQADLLLDRLHGLPDRGLPNETRVFVAEVDGNSLAKLPLAQLPPPENGTGETVEEETDGAGGAGE